METTKVFDRLALHWKPRFYILQGGSSSSKTYSILQYLIALSKQTKGNKLVSIVAETMPSLKRGAMRDFIAILGDRYDKTHHNKTENYYSIGGWRFEFFGADNASKFRGPRRDILFINECNNVSYEAYSQLEMRTRNKVFLDYNPSSEFWVHTDLIPSLKDDEFFFDISTYHDNQFVPPAAVNSIERRKYNSDGSISEYYKVYGQGKVGSLEGSIYTDWEINKTFPRFGDNIPIYHGLDFGFTNDPSCLVKVAIKPEDIYIDELFYEPGLTNMDIIKKLDEKGFDKNNIIYADSAEPKSIKELRIEGGYNVRPSVKGPDSVRVGIDYLLQKRIHVTIRSVNIIKELRSYVWEKDKDGKPINRPTDAFNHAMDAIRYACSPKLINLRARTKRMRF